MRHVAKKMNGKVLKMSIELQVKKANRRFLSPSQGALADTNRRLHWMIEIMSIDFSEPLVTWQDVIPLLSGLGIIFISAVAYLYYKL